jgi:hypothetical protein
LLDRQQYERFRVSPTDPATIRVAHVEAILTQLAQVSGERLRVETFAESFEGRPILSAALGTGARRILMWSQMHGDEPTHTAVVLDLVSYLLQSPQQQFAADILAGCTLHIFPLLNPDGAEHVSRFNAQGIDVNRDARRLATPEGRALRRAVETMKPEFGFNLHNQNARAAVGSPPKPAAVSLLAPPVDASGREMPQMRLAKQMAACFVEAVKPHAEGMISRYDHEFEPRAFGDTIQATGAATMLVEAGGWPEADPEPLVRLHFHGVLATLHAIATGRVSDFDPQVYESLPESNSRNLFDCLVSDGHLLDESFGEPYACDLGIDRSHGARLAITTQREGKIVDIGDLTTSAGKSTIDATGGLILPGRVAVLSDWKPATELSEHELDLLLARGATTVVGSVELADEDALEAIRSIEGLPVNWAFVARLDAALSLSTAELLERIELATARGVLAFVGDRADEALWQHVAQFGMPLLKSKQFAATEPTARTYRDLIQQNQNVCKTLGLDSTRGKVARGYVADFQVFELNDELPQLSPLDWKRLHRVVVAGETVWHNRHRTAATPGTFVHRECLPAHQPQ